MAGVVLLRRRADRRLVEPGPNSTYNRLSIPVGKLSSEKEFMKLSNRRQKTFDLILGLAMACLLAIGSPAFAQTAPSQPTTGPGGSQYTHATVTTNGPYWANNQTTQNQFEYFIYEPGSPTPAQAPVILFLHGYSAFTPQSYLYWIDHMVLKGYTVVWVQYQASALTAPSKYLPNARAAWSDALNRLQNFWWENHVKPQMSTNGQMETLIVGHSVGAFTGAGLAATISGTPTVPVPFGLVLIEPGSKGLVPAQDYSKIYAGTPMVMVIGDQDTVVCDTTASRIWNVSSQIPSSLKNLLWIQSDTHGTPQQLGNHFFPGTSGFDDTAAVDDRDYNITWKLSVAMADCVFGNTTNDPNACSIALGAGNPLQTTMGNWSDNTPVKPLVYYTNPSGLPPIQGCN